VVHFNRLKPCRRDTRLDTSTQQTSSDSIEPSQARHNDKQAAAAPIGTNLEIVDYDDDDVTLVDNQHTVDNVVQNSSNVQDQPSTEMRRYPAREHTPQQDFRTI